MTRALYAPQSPVYSHQVPVVVHTCRHLIFHYGELVLKGRNRHRFEARLIDNIRAKFHHMAIRGIRKLTGRILVEFDSDQSVQTLSDAASRIFGVANATPVHVVGPSFDELAAAVPSLLDGHDFASFAVRCVRAEKRFPLTSQEICQRIGAQVVQLCGARVDLTAPALTVWIEVLSHMILIGVERIASPAGLPVGTSGRVVALLSAGIDSPVAVWRMMQRGCEPVLLHFHSAPFTNLASQEKVMALAQALARWHAPLQLAMIPFAAFQQEIIARTPESYRVLLYRRCMARVATQIAHTVRAEGIVTGDSLGQVASQTLSNLAAVETAVVMPLLRPLVGMDKNEIVQWARRLGTYEISIEPHQDCCNFLEPQHPATRSRASDLVRAEGALDLPALVERTVAGAVWHAVR
ncbi:MAG: tRNA 4-thiouridine(8) synthase ThiI [Deltaproteobacteria bacterium]|nr:tRNA 4-thiouridine(8) synthase ThiI [Deltaproteobacteria bacterium]